MAAKKASCVDLTSLRNARLECLMELYEEFDFGKVAKVMKFLEWKVVEKDECTGEFESVIPTENMLVKDVRYLAETCWKAIDDGQSKEWTVGAGPFEIYWDETDADEVRASLKFVCEEWSSEMILGK